MSKYKRLARALNAERDHWFLVSYQFRKGHESGFGHIELKVSNKGTFTRKNLLDAREFIGNNNGFDNVVILNIIPLAE